MIAYATVVGDSDRYAAIASAGVARCLGPEDVVLQRPGGQKIATAYNSLLDEVVGMRDVEALVLLHEDLEILSPDFGAAVRMALRDPRTAVAGAIGAVDINSLAWWEGEMRGRLRETRWDLDHPSPGDDTVDTVDGCLMVLSPWATEHLRFDDSLPGFHGYDVDFCWQARQRGKRVVVGDFDAFHHTKGGYGDRDAWARANRAWQKKWGVREPAGARLRRSAHWAKDRLVRSSA